MNEQTRKLGLPRTIWVAIWAVLAVAVVVKYATTDPALRSSRAIQLVSSESCPREPDQAIVEDTAPDESLRAPGAPGGLQPAIYVELALPAGDAAVPRFII